MVQDLRAFIELVKAKTPDEIQFVDKEVDPYLEITALLARLEKDERYPVLYFNRVKGSSIPIVTNVAVGYKRFGMAMGLEESFGYKDYFRYTDSFLREYLSRRARMVPPKVVSSGPCKDVILRGDQIDLTRLPIPTTSEKDDAPYITAGFTVVRDKDHPDFPNFNLGIYRHRLIDRKTIGLYYSWGKYIHHVHRSAEEKNEPVEIALCIGCHPALYFAANDNEHLSEYSLAGAFLKEPVQLVKCETNDLYVPSDTEIVIEGKLLPKVRRREGPFGEYAGFYGEVVDAPVVEVSCVTHRRNPLYYFVPSGRHAEHLSGGLAQVLGICSTIKRQYPSVREVSKPWRLSFVVGIRMDKVNDGDPVSVGLFATSLSQYFKYVVVVDGDVDVFDESELLWAIATRCRADEDFVLIPRAKGNRLDPSSYNAKRNDRGSMVTRVVIDATRKFLSEQGTAEIREPLVGRLDLRDYGFGVQK